jgi:hypothetical protein
MQEADLSEAQMQGADLRRALLTGTPETPNILWVTSLGGSTNHGGALRDVDLRPAEFDDRTDWRNAFFDGTVRVPEDRKNQIGQPCLWDWIADNPEPLPDEEFFARWRGWLTLDPMWSDHIWPYFASVPENWSDVDPIDPPDDCTWDHPPLPAAD